MSDKPPLGLRPRWLALEERQREIRDAIKRYDEQAVICPDEWLIELQTIELELAILLPRPEAEPVDAEFTPPAAEIPEPVPPATVAIPSRFVSISRTVLRNGDHVLDAIDAQGLAWWMRIDTSPHHPAFPASEHEWHRLTPLPPRQEPAQ